MIRDNQKFFNTFHVVIDALVIAAAYALAYWIKFSSGLFVNGVHWTFEIYGMALIPVIPV